MVLQDSAIWLSVLCAGLLFVLIVGVLLATRHHRRRGQGGTGGSVTDWGQSLALTYKLRRETRRLSEENLRLWEERAELLKAFGRVVACLQQEVGQISGIGSQSEWWLRQTGMMPASLRRGLDEGPIAMLEDGD